MDKMFTCIDCAHCDVRNIEYSKWFDNVVCMGCDKDKNPDIPYMTPWFDIENPTCAMCEHFEHV